MKKYNETEKEIIKDLLDYNFKNFKVGMNFMQDVFFKDDEVFRIEYIQTEPNGKYYLGCTYSDEELVGENFDKLYKVIYKLQVIKELIDEKYIIVVPFQFKTYNFLMGTKNTPKRKFEFNNDTLPLADFFNGLIIVTTALRKLYNDGFETYEERTLSIANKSLKTTKIAVWVAIATMIVSVVLSLFS
ncbi:MAG: hypothetical protein IKH44_12880 [Bacteroidales bacterium]|nr:hypothetical protein [Bacteroidales bacterium]